MLFCAFSTGMTPNSRPRSATLLPIAEPRPNRPTAAVNSAMNSMAGEYLHSVVAAAKRHISIDTHEPIKDTGLRRTYPNWLTREGARGQEYNAWGYPPNPPEHTALLPFTRMAP